MKNIYLIISCCAVLISQSCATDFDLTADWQEITVVYGLLNPADTAHYIKINKAFLSEDQSAVDIAQIADSLYHEAPISVVLEEYEVDTDQDDGKLLNANFIQEIPLTKINAADVGVEKEEGDFATSPYFLYTTNYQLKPDFDTNSGVDSYFNYELKIITHRGNEVKAETPIIGDFSVQHPNPELSLSWLADTYSMRWKAVPHATIYDIDVYINFDEEKVNDNGTITTERINLKWNLVSNLKEKDHIESNNRVVYTFSTDAFYSYMAQRLSDNLDKVEKRYFDDLTFVIHAASEPLQIFNEVTQAQFSVSATQSISTYTNVTGGLGLIATRHSKTVPEIEFNIQTIDRLACDEVTKHLKFETSSGNPCN